MIKLDNREYLNEYPELFSFFVCYFGQDSGYQGKNKPDLSYEEIMVQFFEDMGIETIEKTLEELYRLQNEQLSEEELYIIISNKLGGSALPRTLADLETDKPSNFLSDVQERLERYLVEIE